jgi:hypothetical protein
MAAKARAFSLLFRQSGFTVVLRLNAGVTGETSKGPNGVLLHLQYHSTIQVKRTVNLHMKPEWQNTTTPTPSTCVGSVGTQSSPYVS